MSVPQNLTILSMLIIVSWHELGRGTTGITIRFAFAGHSDDPCLTRLNRKKAPGKAVPRGDLEIG